MQRDVCAVECQHAAFAASGTTLTQLSSSPGIPSEGQPGGSANLGFDPPPRVQKLVAHLKQFMEEHIYPSEHILNAHAADPKTKWTVHPRMEELKVAHSPTSEPVKPNAAMSCM